MAIVTSRVKGPACIRSGNPEEVEGDLAFTVESLTEVREWKRRQKSRTERSPLAAIVTCIVGVVLRVYRWRVSGEWVREEEFSHPTTNSGY